MLSEYIQNLISSFLWLTFVCSLIATLYFGDTSKAAS